jgi:hypothetical protein
LFTCLPVSFVHARGQKNPRPEEAEDVRQRSACGRYLIREWGFWVGKGLRIFERFIMLSNDTHEQKIIWQPLEGHSIGLINARFVDTSHPSNWLGLQRGVARVFFQEFQSFDDFCL